MNGSGVNDSANDVTGDGVQYDAGTDQMLYYKDGQVDYTYTGTAVVDDVTYTVTAGVATPANGVVVQSGDTYYYYTDGEVDKTYTGTATDINGNEYTVTNGEAVKVTANTADDDQKQTDDQKTSDSDTDSTTQKTDTGSRMTATQAEAAQAITYAAASYWYLWVILAAAVVAALILGKRRSRAVWLDRVDALNPGDGVQNLYRFYLLGLEKSGCRRGRSLTLDEYMCLNEKGIQKFDDGDSKAFGQLTPIYEKTCYGGQEISQEEYALVRGYYNGFHKKVRRAVGRFRYLFLYFRL